MVERIGWKPSSHAPYKNPALETLSPSILQHLCLWECKARISRCIVIFACTIYVPWFVGGWRGIFHFFFSSSLAWDSKELAMEITSLNPDFLGESNYMSLCKNNIKLSAAVGLVKWRYKQPINLLTVVGVKRISRIERLEIELIWNWLVPLPQNFR